MSLRGPEAPAAQTRHVTRRALRHSGPEALRPRRLTAAPSLCQSPPRSSESLAGPYILSRRRRVQPVPASTAVRPVRHRCTLRRTASRGGGARTRAASRARALGRATARASAAGRWGCRGRPPPRAAGHGAHDSAEAGAVDRAAMAGKQRQRKGARDRDVLARDSSEMGRVQLKSRAGEGGRLRVARAAVGWRAAGGVRGVEAAAGTEADLKPCRRWRAAERSEPGPPRAAMRVAAARGAERRGSRSGSILLARYGACARWRPRLGAVVTGAARQGLIGPKPCEDADGGGGPGELPWTRCR